MPGRPSLRPPFTGVITAIVMLLHHSGVLISAYSATWQLQLSSAALMSQWRSSNTGRRPFPDLCPLFRPLELLCALGRQLAQASHERGHHGPAAPMPGAQAPRFSCSPHALVCASACTLN